MSTAHTAAHTTEEAAWPPWRKHPAFEPKGAPADLVQRAEAAGWPDGLLARASALAVNRVALEAWIDHGFPTPDIIDQIVRMEELLASSTLKLRIATWADVDLLADLFTHAPETVGDWTVTVERGPDPFAAFRLQENSHVLVLEDQRVALGAVAHAVRNTLVAGVPTTVHAMSACRVRDGLRGLGFSHWLLNGPGPGTALFGLMTYWYGRSGNASRPWLDRVVGEFAERPGAWAAEAEGLTATVHHLSAAAGDARPDPRVRPATPADLPACVELINRTHQGLDLFRPWSVERLQNRLDQERWGPRPWFALHLYGWDDFRVLEAGGAIVACAGLWDRGANLRERWRSTVDGTTFTADPAALMDFGYADGHPDALAALIGHHLHAAATLGRSGLLAPLEHHPDVLERCQAHHPVPDTRTLEVMPFRSPDLTVDLPITRPYTDLAYW